MNISDLIYALQRAERAHGNLPVSTYDSDINRVIVEPSADGIRVSADPTELVIEFQ